MLKFSIKLAALFAACSMAFTDAAAQSAAVMRKLHAKYDRVTPFAEGLAAVTRNGISGYVDTEGNLVVPLIYNQAVVFRNGRAVVGKGKSGVRKFALIDRSGRELTPFTWDHLGNVNDGVAVAWNREGAGRNYALVDTLGNVISIEYALCRDFSNGLAVAGVGELRVESVVQPGMTRVPDKFTFTGKYGYITSDGKWAIPAQFDEARSFNDDGLAPVGMQSKYYVKWGFIDREGKVVIPCNFYSVSDFSRDLALVSKVVAGGRLAYGYIDRTGEEVIPCRYDEGTSFKFKNTWVGMEQDGEMNYMLIDAGGNALMAYTVLNLQDGGKYGQAACAIRDDKGRLRYGILTNDGRTILPFEYDEITIFSEWDAEKNRWQEAAMGSKDGKPFSVDISIRK